jgi:hypothetical protein
LYRTDGQTLKRAFVDLPVSQGDFKRIKCGYDFPHNHAVQTLSYIIINEFMLEGKLLFYEMKACVLP